MSPSTLRVLVDGAPLPEEEARAIWERFSAWMEEHHGDLAGFAQREGFASVHPGVDEGRPVLRLSTTAEQRPYTSVTRTESEGGSGSRQNRGRDDRGRRRTSKK